MRRLSLCPVCHEKKFNAFLSCKDHTVSHETFSLEKCEACGLVMTNPQPEEHELPRYYLSDDYISHSNRTRGVIDSLYKIARVYTLRWKYNLVRQHAAETPASLLDYGCGTGAFLAECKKHHMSCEGVEPSDIARSEAIRLTQSQVHATIDNVRRSFDIITLWHVLEHVADLNDTLDKLTACLAKNGTMFIAVPNLNSHDAAKYREHWAAYDVPRHLWHFTRQSMETLLKNHSLTLHNVHPMKLDAFYVSLLSEKYNLGANSIRNIALAMIEGLKSNNAANQTNEYSSLIYIVRK